MKEQSHTSEEPASYTLKLDDSDTTEKMTLVDGAKIAGAGLGIELVIFLIGAGILGAAYTIELHVLAVIIVIPMAFLFYKWIKST